MLELVLHLFYESPHITDIDQCHGHLMCMCMDAEELSDIFHVCLNSTPNVSFIFIYFS